MKFSIDEKIFTMFRELVLGVIIVNDIDNSQGDAELAQQLHQAAETIQATFTDELIAQNPMFESWRNAYRAFGAKPKDYRCSVENLYRLVIKGVVLNSINPLVDCYNITSLRRTLPVGGEDLNRIQGDIQLTIAGEHENSVLLLGDKEARAPHLGEVIYKDEQGAICRRFNWREADRTKLTPSSTNAILVIEGLPPISRASIEDATKELASLISKFCGGNNTIHILDKNNSSATL